MSAAAPARKAAPRRGLIGRIFSPITGRIAGKIIAPYLVLMLILALLATFIVTRLLNNSLQDRFNARLQDAGTGANDAMVKLEGEYLGALRLMTNTEGVAEALQAQDRDKLQDLLLPLQANAHLDLVDVIGMDGKEVLALRGDEVAGIAQQLTDESLGQTALAQKIINGESDQLGDKWTALVPTKFGVAIYAGAPVRDADGNATGLVMVGATIDRALARLSRDAQARLTLFDSDGKVLQTTLPLDASDTSAEAHLAINTGIVGTVMGDNASLVRRPLSVGGKDYQELIGTLDLRTKPAAPMGVALPADFISEAQFASRNQLTAMFGVVVLGVLLLGISLARAITRPIALLVKATEGVAKGDLNVEVPVTTGDETGKLTVSFNQMVDGLRERDKVKNMFSQYVTGDVADAVMRGEVKLGGAKLETSILITDIRSFTTLSESLDPEPLVSMLNRYFDKMIDSIMEYEGTIDKFLGDGIIAEYNVPLKKTRFALRAVLTCLRMREHLAAFNEDQKARGEPTIRIGMGVHTGYAVVGNIGSEGKKLEYTAMGDTVNVASRLQDQTKEVKHDIVISADTYHYCADLVEVGEPMALQVKGRLEPVIAHKVIGLKEGHTLSPALCDISYEVEPLQEHQALQIEDHEAAAATIKHTGLIEMPAEALVHHPANGTNGANGADAGSHADQSSGSGENGISGVAAPAAGATPDEVPTVSA